MANFCLGPETKEDIKKYAKQFNVSESTLAYIVQEYISNPNLQEKGYEEFPSENYLTNVLFPTLYTRSYRLVKESSKYSESQYDTREEAIQKQLYLEDLGIISVIYKSYDGKKFRVIPATYTDLIVPNKGQLEAINKVVEYIEGKSNSEGILVTGKAGTGKTSIVNNILDKVRVGGWTKPTVFVVSVANKAVRNLEQKINERNNGKYRIKGKSLAALLNYREQYDETKEKTAWKRNGGSEEAWQRGIDESIPMGSIVFLDEASMVNETQYAELLKVAKRRNLKIICIGDEGQLPPLREDINPAINSDAPSPIFTDSRLDRIQLLERVRQGEDSPILDYADRFWEYVTGGNYTGAVPNTAGTSNVSSSGAIVIESKSTDIIGQSFSLFKKAFDTANPYLVKIVAFRNETIDRYNQEIHQRLTGSTEPKFFKGEMFISNAPLIPEGAGPGEVIMHNAEEGTIEEAGEIFETEDTYTVEGYQNSYVVSVPKVKLQRVTIKIPGRPLIKTTCVVRTKENLEAYRKFKSAVASFIYKSGEVDKREQGRAYAAFMDYFNSIANISFGYAITSHKSQGSTYETSIVDTADIMSVKPISKKDKAASIYTGITRASKTAIILSNEVSSSDSRSIEEINDSVKKTQIIPDTNVLENTDAEDEDLFSEESVTINGVTILYRNYKGAKKDSDDIIYIEPATSAEQVISKYWNLENHADKYLVKGLHDNVKTVKDAQEFHIIYQNIKQQQNISDDVEIYNEAIRRYLAYKGVQVPTPQSIAMETATPAQREALNIINKMIENNQRIVFDKKSHTYTVNGVQTDSTVSTYATQTSLAQKAISISSNTGEDFNDVYKRLWGEFEKSRNKKGGYLDVSAAWGNTYDAMARDFFSLEGLKSWTEYPNVSKEVYTTIQKQLAQLKKQLIEAFGEGIYIETREEVLRIAGKVGDTTLGGTMDMLVIDRNGVFHVVDFKTKRGGRANGSYVAKDIDDTKMNQYSLQTLLYTSFIEQTYGAKTSTPHIAKFNLYYPTPIGEINGEVSYIVENDEISTPAGKVKKESIVNNQLAIVPISLSPLIRIESPSVTESLNVTSILGNSTREETIKIAQETKKEAEPVDIFYEVPEAFKYYDIPIQLVNRESLDGKLASVNKNTVRVARDVTVEEFFDYISGKIDSPTSKQKKEVFKRLSNLGYGSILKDIIKTPDDVKKLLAYHELSHTFYNDIENYYEPEERNGGTKNWMAENKINIEMRATIDAIQRLLAERQASKEEIEDTIDTLEGKKDMLSDTEKKEAEKAMPGFKPKVLIASEASDPVWHVKEIKEKIQKEYEKDPHTPKMLYVITKHDGLPLIELANIKQPDGRNIPKFFHFSITSLGGTEYEPGVMKMDDMLDKIEELIKKGILNPNLVTIRIDPIIPGVTKSEDIRHIMERGTKMGIRNYRFSVMDSYKKDTTKSGRNLFIIDKMSKLGYNWDTYYGRDSHGDINFHAKQDYIEATYRLFDSLAEEFNVFVNTCGEDRFNFPGLKRVKTHVGCVNVGTMNAAMGTTNIEHVEGTQRVGSCSCYGFKSDMLNYGADCMSSCIYCYAGHNQDTPVEYYNPDGTLKINALTYTDRSKLREDLKRFRTQPKKKLTSEDTDIISTYVGKWTRESVASDPRTLYIFTDNTDRDSGSGKILPDSWYSQRYGEGHHYPTATTAQIRGLENARPISTVKWFYKLHKGVTHPKYNNDSKALWHDSDIEEFKRVIDAEINDIIEAWNTGQFDRVKLPSGDGLFGADISKITKERVPDIYNYLQEKYKFLVDTINSTPREKKLLSGFVNHSGGAQGADTLWDVIGAEYGVRSKHYYVDSRTPRGNTPLTLVKEASAPNELGVNRAYELIAEAARRMGRTVPITPVRYSEENPERIQKLKNLEKESKLSEEELKKNREEIKELNKQQNIFRLLIRDVKQVLESDSVFAVGSIDRSNNTVLGGTGYAVEVAKILLEKGGTKPIYVFDLVTNKWYSWSADDRGVLGFYEVDTPILTKNFAGIGTRRIDSNREDAYTQDVIDNAKNAMREVFEKAVAIQEALSTTPTTKEEKERPILIGNKFYTLEQSQVQTDTSSLNGEYTISIDTGVALDEEYKEEAFKLNVLDVLPISSRVRFAVNEPKDITPEILQAVTFLSKDKFFYSDIDNGVEYSLTDLPSHEIQTVAINLGLVQKVGDERIVRIPAFTKGYTSERMRVMAQENALFESPEFIPSELRTYAKAAVYKLSEIVTKIQNGGPEAAFYLGSVDADKFKGKERIEIIQSFGLQRLYTLLRKELFEARVLPTRKQRKKVDVIRANFEAFMELGFGTLRDLENIEIADGNSRVREQGITLFTEEEEQQIQELYGNSLEHWQVGFRSVSTFASLSQQLKHMLDTFKDLDGTGGYKMNGLEMPESVNVQTAVSLILSWCSDCQNIDQMIEKLKAKVSSNPWVLQLVNTDPDKKDSTGRTIGLGVLVQGTPESERMKSLFFNNFKKYFQPYTIIYKDKNGKTLMKEINKGNKADEIFSTLDSVIKMNTHPAFDNGIIKESVLGEIAKNYKKLPIPVKYSESSEEEKDTAIDAVINILNILGIDAPERAVLEAYLKDNYKGVYDSIAALERLKGLKIEKSTKNINGIKGLVNRMSSLIDAGYEAVSYEAGKLYYSYVYPSYLSNLTETLQGKNMTEEEYKENLEALFDSEWFKEEIDTIDGKRTHFRTPWLRTLYERSSDARKAFKHIVCLKGFGETYSDKSFASYTATMVANYFYDDNKKYAYFRVPIMSNKPSEEYIRFYRISVDYEGEITDRLIADVFTQEIDRIVTVKERLDSDGRIANFDSNNILEGGRKFHFLDYLNPYVKDYIDYMRKSNSDMSVIPAELFEEGNSYLLLGGLLYKKMEGYKLSEENNETGLLTTLLESTIKREVNRRFQSAMETWIRKGFIMPTKNKKGEITGWKTKDVNLGSTYEDIEKAMKEFYWNDMFAAINILELTINDPAFYRDAEDLQKRLAQIHAPGTRMNLDAVDTWNSSDKTQTLFSDGIFRFVTINDENVISGCYNQVKELFESQLNKITNPAEKALFKAQMDRTLEALSEITHTDGQGYSSPTAYRKKLGMLGRWNDDMEQAYQEILSGNLTTQNMQLLMQPLKPFAYGNVIQRGKGPISKLRVGTQIKDSEYALIIADALLRGAGVKSKLSAIFDVMEESHGLKKVNGKWTGIPNGKGIDTVVFNSAVKTGNFGVLNLDSDNPYKTLRDAVYYEGGPEYNSNFVKEIGFENYIIQQEVPAHFEGEQQLGSQTRALIFADLMGDDIIIVDGKSMKIEDARKEFFELQAANVEESFRILSEELNLDQKDIKLQNIAISKILRKAILADSRFGSDLLWACSTNKDGEFNIPLTDPTQSVRVQQLLNSVIKNRINKQEMPGGPVVQVSSFGADELNIVYNSIEGKLMLSEKQFNEFKQGKSFSSDKYTLPENGETYKQYLKKQAGIAYYEAYAPIYDPALLEFEKSDGTIDVEAIERVNPDMLKLIGYRIPTEARYSMAPIKIIGFLPRNAGEAIILPSEWVAQTGSDFDVDKVYLIRQSFYNVKPSIEEIAGKFATQRIESEEKKNPNKYGNDKKERENNKGIVYHRIQEEALEQLMAIERGDDENVTREVYDFYMSQRSQWVRGRGDRAKRNDRSFQIMWGVLTSKAAASSIITQGGAFERTKKQAYGIAAVKEGTLNYSDIEGRKTKELKTLFYKEKNLIYNDVHTGFFEQNMIAAKLIGIFAQANVSHAFISMSSSPVFITLTSEFKFIYDDKNGNQRRALDSSHIELDEIYGLKGQRVSSVLAELLASSVDAVKDPILNLLQINIDTANIVVTLARMGFDIDQIALITSQPVVREVLDVMQSEDTYLENALHTVLNSKTKDSGADVITGILSEEMLVKGLTENDDKIDIEILNFLSGILEASRFVSVITHMTRYNSVASAVGPRASNTSYQMKQDDTFYSKISSGEISPSIMEAINNPVLAAFRDRSHYLAENILAPRIIEATPGFKMALNVLENTAKYTTESISSQYADFFTSWMVQNNYHPVFDTSYERRMYMHSEFPSKIVEKKAQYPDNKFLQALLFVQKDNDQYPVLELRMKGLTNEDIEDLKSSWDALYDIEPQLAIELFEYAYNRGSFGFSPKTFINLTPNRIKRVVGDGIYISNTEKALKNCNSTLQVDMLMHIANQFLLHHPDLIPSLDSESIELEDDAITPEYGQNTYVASKDPLEPGAPLGLYKTTIQGKEVPVYIVMDNYKYHLYVLDYLGGAGRGFEIDTNLGVFPKSVFDQNLVSDDTRLSEPKTDNPVMDFLNEDLRALGNFLYTFKSVIESEGTSAYDAIVNSNIPAVRQIITDPRYTAEVVNDVYEKIKQHFGNPQEVLKQTIDNVNSQNNC